MLSPPVAGRAPRPYLALGPRDAERLGAREGQLLGFALHSAGAPRLSLPVRIDASLPEGLAGLPVGLPGQPFLDLPAEIEIGEGGGHV